MNIDEAKVPKVDGDWRSIEIFLFSNGQQYSPPRKYYLGVEDLNLWAATLNLLGRAQYGVQSPPIDLYTTDGQLVEGPLELKDGQAYVAVAPPDTFIDTGYQKYLLKATRSWEKRQGRKKVPECIPGEPCCLCPEKEYCCDLQKCCLCPEREDAETSSLLLRASGLMPIKSGGGHYMSTAPTKRDGYEPLSKIEGTTAGKHEVSPDKYGHSSVLIQARPDDNEVTPVEHTARSVTYDARSSENPLILGENGPRLTKYGAKPGEYEPNSGNNGPLAIEDKATESGSERSIIKNDANEIVMEKRLNDNNDTPNKDTKFRKHSSILNHFGESKLEKKDEYAVKDYVNSDEPSGRENVTIALDAPKLDSLERKNENASRLSDIDIENEVRIAEPTREFVLGSRTSQPISDIIHPVGKKVSENEAKQGEHRKKQDDHVARLNNHESKGGDKEGVLENSGSERSAKVAASGSKATPRDRFSSRARNPILHKLEIPSTIIDEAAEKLDESDIKDKVTPRKNSLPAGRLSIEKKRLSIGQNSSLLKKPAPYSSVLRKSEDKKSMKPNKEIFPKRTPGSSSTTPSSASSDKSKPPKLPFRRLTPIALPPATFSYTNLLPKQEGLQTDKNTLEKVTDVKQATDISTYLFHNQDSELKSSMYPTAKLDDCINNFPEETQTELNFGNSKPSTDSRPITDSKGVQTEAVEQQGKDVCLCNQLNYRITTVGPDENIISILNKGDIINLKLNIEVKNIVHSSPKNSPKSRSLTDITRSEKESQISIDDDKSQPSGNEKPFRGYGFEGSPRVMIVQCAGCGMLNNPALRDLPPRSDNDKNYLALLTSPVHEDNTIDSYYCNHVNSAQSQQCDHKQSQTRKPYFGTNPLSDLTLDTITTVTVSGGPSAKREAGNCAATNTSCRTEEAQNDCVLTTRKVSISDDSGTKCSFQEQSVSSLSVTKYTDNMSNCIKTCKYKEIQVCSEFCPPVCTTTCQNVKSECSKPSVQIYPLVLSKGCQPICPQTQTQGCSPISTTCVPCCPGPPPTPVSSQGCTLPSLPTCPSCCPKALPTSTCPSCCSKSPSTPSCPPCCPKPPPTPACAPCCPKAPSTPTCPPCCPKAPPTPACAPCCPKPPPTPTCPPCCPNLSPIPVCPQGCTPPPLPTCPPCCPKPRPRTACSQGCIPPVTCCPKMKPMVIQIQTDLCPQGSQFCDAQTQTRWASIALQARLHCDGRYSFHLPPLDMLNSFPI